MRSILNALLLISIVFLLNACQAGDNPVAQANAGAPEDQHDQSSSFSYSYEGEQLQIQSNNTYFDFTYYNNKNEQVPVAIKVNKQITLEDLDEEKIGDFSFEASLFKEKKLKKKWKLETQATDYQYRFYSLLTRKRGEAEDSYELYNLENGDKIMAYTYDQMEMLVPNVLEKRLVGFFGTYGQGEEKELLEKENAYGILTYASNKRSINRFLIRIKNPEQYEEINEYTPEMRFVSQTESDKILREDRRLILWDKDETFDLKETGNFEVELNIWLGSYDNTFSLVFPVNKDQIELAAIQYDKEKFEVIAID